MLAKLSAVIAGRDSEDVGRSGRRVQAPTHGRLHGLEAQTVDHDFVDRVASGGQLDSRLPPDSTPECQQGLAVHSARGCSGSSSFAIRLAKVEVVNKPLHEYVAINTFAAFGLGETFVDSAA